MDYRQGKGRAAVTKKGKTIKGSKSRAHVRSGTSKSGLTQVGSKTAGSGGTRRITGKKNVTASGRRRANATSVVKEKKASAIKKRGVKKAAPKAKALKMKKKKK